MACTPSSKNAFRLWFVLIFFAIMIRSAVILSDVRLFGDAGLRYDPIARNLQIGNGFSRSSQAPYIPDDFDQPGYPYFLALIYKFTSGSLKAVVVAQLFLEALILFLVVRVGRWLKIPERAGVSALALGLICPFLPLFAGKILTEVLATFVVTLTCYMAVRCALDDGLKWWVLSGIGMGACLLVRPDLLVSVALMMLTLGLISWRKYRLRLCRRILIQLVSALIILTPWMIRNYRLFHSPRPLGGTASQVKSPYVKWLDTWLDDPKYIDQYWWHAANPGYPADLPDNIPDEDRAAAMRALVTIKERGTFSDETDREFLFLAVEARKSHWLKVYALTPFRRAIMTWLRAPSYIPVYSLKLVVYGFWLAFLVCVLAGLVKIVRRKDILFAIPLALVLGRLSLPLISALGSEPRYMFEALPVCFIIAGTALPGILNFVKGHLSGIRLIP